MSSKASRDEAGSKHDQDGVFDPRSEVQRELRRMLDRVLPVGLVFAALAMGGSAVRAMRDGWQPLFTVHAVLSVCVLVLYAFRKRLSFQAFFVILLTIGALDGAANMLTFGLATNGFLVFACVTIFASLAFGRRGAVVAIAASIIVWVSMGILFTSRPPELTEALITQLYSPWSWVSQITAAALFVTIVITGAYVTQRKLMRSLMQEHARRQEIERVNTALSKEVAQRERAERELADREKKFRMLAENMNDAMFVQDPNLNVVYASPACGRLSGYSQDELIGMRMSDILTPESLQRAAALYGKYFQLAMQNEDVDVPLMEYEYRRKDGTTFWGELRVGFLRDEEGRLEGSQGILRDVTERRRAAEEKLRLEAQLRQSEKMRAIGQLAGGIAHDFNNQLTGITMGAGLIARGLPDRTDILRYVDFVQTCAKRSSDLTLKLLAFARHNPSLATPTNVHDLIREVVSILDHSVGRSIGIQTRLAANRCVVRADGAQLQSALLNIGVNARDAMPTGGQLEFCTEVVQVTEPTTTVSGLEIRPGDYLRVRIQDTGDGMDETTQKRIFEPFFTTKPSGRGTGLGLSTVYGTVKGLDGAIDLTSALGEGSTFDLYLPVMPEGTEVALGQPVRVERGSGRLLLVEDEETVRAATQEMLGLLGYDVDSCGDGEEAVRMSEGGPFDGIVLDVNLPTVGGKEAFGRIRAKAPEARVLFISGNAPDGLEELLGQPHVRFVQKPFTDSDLSLALQSLLRD
jgi:PAS domain S-box-containing protein